MLQLPCPPARLPLSLLARPGRNRPAGVPGVPGTTPRPEARVEGLSEEGARGSAREDVVQALDVGACQELVHAVIGATGHARDFFGVSASFVGACQDLVAVVGATGGARGFFVFSSLRRNSNWLLCLRRFLLLGGGGGGGTPATVRPFSIQYRRGRRRGRSRAAAPAAVQRRGHTVGFRRGPPSVNTCSCSNSTVCWRGRGSVAAAGVPGGHIVQVCRLGECC